MSSSNSVSRNLNVSDFAKVDDSEKSSNELTGSMDDKAYNTMGTVTLNGEALSIPGLVRVSTFATCEAVDIWDEDDDIEGNSSRKDPNLQIGGSCPSTELNGPWGGPVHYKKTVTQISENVRVEHEKNMAKTMLFFDIDFSMICSWFWMI